jgi:hypothetical protein
MKRYSTGAETMSDGGFIASRFGPTYMIGVLLLGVLGSQAVAGSFAGDHLIPLKKPFDARGPELAYRTLWQRKLLVTGGEVARSVHLPGNVGVETVVSVYRGDSERGAGYYVTATQASRSLWDCVAPDAKKPVNADSIRIVRADAPLPTSTAVIVGKVWVAMLRRTREGRKADKIWLDSSKEIFSAVAPDGRMLLGELRGLGERRTSALSNLAGSLFQYCGAPVSQRPQIARSIEEAAAALLKEIEH